MAHWVNIMSIFAFIILTMIIIMFVMTAAKMIAQIFVLLHIQ